MTLPSLISGLDALYGAADAFLLDQFGTLHDGTALYPGVVPALRQARAAGKRILILSNSGKRAAANAERLDRLGLPGDCYDGILTSGEVLWQLLANRTLPALTTARHALVLTRGPGDDALAGLPLERTEDADAAELILLLGSEADRIGLDAYRQRLQRAAARRIPCLCGNPDWLMVLGESGTAPAPGQIAALYAEMGGPVVWVGKPYPAIYDAAFAALAALAGHSPDPARVWAVGDSLEHDIAGAAAQGCRTALVMTGILAGTSLAAVEAEIATRQARPDVILSIFR